VVLGVDEEDDAADVGEVISPDAAGYITLAFPPSLLIFSVVQLE
jgi:hypothetical protein